MRLLGLLILTSVAACSVNPVSYTPLGSSDQGPPADAGVPPIDASPPPPPSCSDGKRNGTETDVDCGGSCGPCGVGLGCVAAGVCNSDVCGANGTCAPPSCVDGVKNGNETDRDCGGSCGPCGVGLGCVSAGDCSSDVCGANGTCAPPSCADGLKNGDETDVDCGGATCGGCGFHQACAIDRDCGLGGVCDTGACRVAQSCNEIFVHHPGIADGAYSISPTGNVFGAVCDMSTDGGGWTLLLKANGDTTFGFDAAAWTDDSVLNATDLTTNPGNAKYPSFLLLPITTLRGDLDGFRYTHAVTGTAGTTFASSVQSVVAPFTAPSFNILVWPTQPHCQTFGINIPPSIAGARFGWSANQEEEGDCATNDTAIGLGIKYNVPSKGIDIIHGAGRLCQADGCVLDGVNTGISDVSGNGLLWGR